MTIAKLLQTAKPILFNAEMVRAILDGRKTVTRRVIKPQPKDRIAFSFAGYRAGKWGYPAKDVHKYWGEKFKRTEQLTTEEENRYWTPPCHTDDILYARETFSEVETVDGKPYYIYKADDNGAYYNHMYSSRENFEKWHPSIHMPKEAARIFLRVTGVRAERIQDIAPEECISEGVREPTYKSDRKTALGTFADLWDSTIPKKNRELYGWEANPWVWVIEFERVEVQE